MGRCFYSKDGDVHSYKSSVQEELERSSNLERVAQGHGVSIQTQVHDKSRSLCPAVEPIFFPIMESKKIAQGICPHPLQCNLSLTDWLHEEESMKGM